MAELIHPDHLLTMSSDSIDEFMSTLRARRERIKATLKKVQSRRASLGKQELGARLEVYAIKLAKAIDSVDRAMTKAETVYAQTIALRLQHGDATALEPELDLEPTTEPLEDEMQ
jgi:hypothetical protein